jgi:hypothetical protein
MARILIPTPRLSYERGAGKYPILWGLTPARDLIAPPGLGESMGRQSSCWGTGPWCSMRSRVPQASLMRRTSHGCSEFIQGFVPAPAYRREFAGT